ncbi:hypothetical protein BGY98DRAFT_1096413 [Russula aff. rugulosa BPL654]|nr:hypothetical protein BGY98DRAFT_1096413 [Russula aff. rugulosa BPL654]
MRRCKIVTWILILSVVNFALGAPAALRCRSGTTHSTGTNLNVADHPSTPLSLNPSVLERSWEELGEEYIDWHFPPTSESPGLTESVESKRRDDGLTGGPPMRPPRPPPPPPPPYPFDLPLPHPFNPPPPHPFDPPPPHPLHLPPLDPGLSEDRLPSPPGSVVNPDTLSSTVHQTTRPLGAGSPGRVINGVGRAPSIF